MTYRGKSTTRGAPLAFIQYAKSYSGDDYLIWPFARNSNGYGHLYLPNGTGISAARLVCQEAHGNPPSPRHETAHSCGNGHLGCVTPKHLRWATPKENCRDRIVHGTQTRGQDINTNKLTESEVIEIHRMLQEGKRSKISLARQFNIGNSSIHRIKSGAAWGWLTGVSP